MSTSVSLGNDISIHERVDSLLNDSQSKAAYSFPRAIRFKKETKKDISYSFYNLPEIKNNRSTCLGYGKKCDYDKILGCGSNQLYSYPSSFDPNQHNSPQYTFGVSRATNKRQEHSPGPKYNCSSKLCDGISGYIFGKEGSKKKMERSSSMPGPGYYYNERNHGLSQSFSSKLINSASIVIGNAKRFPGGSKDLTPGPGEYNVGSLINQSGTLFNSKYLSRPARSILGSRKLAYVNRSQISPGPGSYNSFSIFSAYSKGAK